VPAVMEWDPRESGGVWYGMVWASPVTCWLVPSREEGALPSSSQWLWNDGQVSSWEGPSLVGKGQCVATWRARLTPLSSRRQISGVAEPTSDLGEPARAGSGGTHPVPTAVGPRTRTLARPIHSSCACCAAAPAVQLVCDSAPNPEGGGEPPEAETSCSGGSE
jgi:hypothetical protein